MIMVIGSVNVKPDCIAEAMTLSLDHVQRSRDEEGCLDHRVSTDAENEHRLVFVEYWSDIAALKAHFALEASQNFVRKLTGLLSDSPSMKIYHVDEVTVS